MKIVKYVLLVVLVLGAIACYFARSFAGPHLHHELNDGGGVLLIAGILVFFLFPDGDEDDD